MEPWKLNGGLSAALCGSARLLVGRSLETLAPYGPVILAGHGVAIAWHAGLATATVAAALYGLARVAGLSRSGGRRVDLIGRSVRHGEGNPGLADALPRDQDGDRN